MDNQAPDQGPPKELGLPGVESVGVDADGRTVVVFNPVLARQQWPGVSALSASFEKLTTSEKLYQQSLAFLSSAKLLSESAGQRGAAGEDITWSQGAVCYYCIHIATELFLKACITECTSEAPKTHDIQKLMTSYREHFPGQDFQFQVPLAWLVESSSFERLIDRAPDQLYRYGVGKDGAGSSMTHQFVPDIVFNRVEHYSRVWQRAWNEARQRG